MPNTLDRVYVYFNLHKLLFSIKALSGPQKNRVSGHSSFITLENVKFRVGEGGRQRVLREQKKNVHAGAVGTLISQEQNLSIPESAVRVTYNPYKFGYFYKTDTEEPVYFAKKVYLDNKKIYILEI